MTNIINDIFKESFGTTVSFRFKNFISHTNTNEEQRVVQWDQPLLAFDLAREVLTQEELNAILSFHKQQNGRENSFLYLDPFDNFIDKLTPTLFFSNEPNVARMYTEGTVSLVGENRYKIQKKYIGEYNSNTSEAFMSVRDINYPFNLVLYDTNQNVCTDWIWNSETHEIETNCELYYWCKFNFYIPVRFGEDELEYQCIGYDGVDALYSIAKMSLIEVRESHHNYTNLYKSYFDHYFGIDCFADSQTLFQSNTLIEEVDSGFEQRENNNSDLFKINLGDRLLNPKEIEYLICLYRVTRGSGARFNLTDLTKQNNYIVRFDSDFSLSLESETNCGVSAKINNLSLTEVTELDPSVIVNDFAVSFQEAKKYNLYYGFSSANGAEYSQSKIMSAFINGQQFIGGGNVPKTVNGYASFSDINGEVELVPNTKKTVGSCFVSSPLDNSFNIDNFSFYFFGRPSKDGLAFILHGQTTGPNAIGVMDSALGNSINYLTTAQILELNNIEGKSLGYVGIAPSIIIELDGYQNDFDPNNNHVGININGSLSSYVTASPSFTLRQNNIAVWIDYVNPTLRVYVNNSETKPSTPLIETNIVIKDYLGYYQETVYSSVSPSEKGLSIPTLCYCWKIVRTDGVIVGATNHDKDLYIDNILYKANGGFSTSSIDTDYEMTVDNSEIKSFFLNDAITEIDIIGGKYDEAEVFLYLVDWNYGNNILSIIQSGIIGEISNTNRTYTLEVRNIFELLTKKNTKKTSSNCPLVFGQTGENKCNKDLSGLFADVVVTEVASNKQFTITSGYSDGYFDFGTIEFLTGLNIGLIFDIYSFSNNTVTLWQNVPFGISINDSIRITKGCEKSLKACQAYNNVANFGGDPFVPGADTYLTGALEYSNPID